MSGTLGTLVGTVARSHGGDISELERVTPSPREAMWRSGSWSMASSLCELPCCGSFAVVAAFGVLAAALVPVTAERAAAGEALRTGSARRQSDPELAAGTDG